MKAPETLAGMVALASRLGFRVVFLGNPPLGARLYGAGWNTVVYEKEGELWQAQLHPEKKIIVVSRLG